MSNKQSEIKFNFKNHLIDYQSNLKGFNEKIFNEFDKKSKDLNLFEKIKELKDGGKVNFTENKSLLQKTQLRTKGIRNIEAPILICNEEVF